LVVPVATHVISSAECRAMRLLYRDGWTTGELKMTFHLSGAESVRYHITGECSHGHDEPACRLR